MSRIAPALLAALGLWVCGGDSAQADGRKKGSHPAAASSQWRGFYVGAGVGSAWGESGFVFEGGAPAVPSPFDLDSAIAGGIHVGYQRQWGSIVGGIEASALFSNMSGGGECPNDDYTCNVHVNWILMIGPRLGVATGNLHFYGTGGFAIGSLESRTVEVTTGAMFDRGDGQHSGWYLGGGVEWSLSRAVVLGVEYRHIELGDDTHRSSSPFLGGNRDVDASISTVQGRLTLKLGD